MNYSHHWFANSGSQNEVLRTQLRDANSLNFKRYDCNIITLIFPHAHSVFQKWLEERVELTLRETCLQENLKAPVAFKNLMIH
jgi:hypothetical protein